MNLKWYCDDQSLRGGRLAYRRFMMLRDNGILDGRKMAR